MREFQSILFVELLGGIGDVLIALPAIQALGRSHPTAQLTVLTFAPGGELLQHHPFVQRVVYAQRGEARSALDQLLATETFDLIVSDTTYEGIADAICSSPASRTIPNLWRSPPPDQRVSDRFLQLLVADGVITADPPHSPEIYLLPSERIAARQQFGAARRPLIFLGADAGMAIKRWSIEHWITVGQALHQQFGATIVVPIADDPEFATQIVSAIGGAQVWPRGSLRQLAAGMAEADLVIAVDTGLAHLAAALTIPTVTLFGPSWHERYGQSPPHVNLQGHPTCPERVIRNFTEQACWYRGTCPIADWHTCVDEISPDAVLAAVASLLKAATPPAAAPAPPAQPLSLPDSSPWRSVRNLLVMRLDNIGDVMMTSPALQALKENLPQANLTLMASPGGALTAPLLPWVDDVLPWRVLWQDLGRLDFNPEREWELIRTLHDRAFDAAIIFTSFSQSPHPAGLVCALAGIPLRLGESKEADLSTLTHAVPAAPDEWHQVERNLRLIEAVGFAVRDRRLCLQVPDLPSPIASPYLLLNPWTSCQSRNYASDRFAIAARQLSEQTGLAIVITGVEKDRQQAGPLFDALESAGGNHSAPATIDLIGKTDLAELVALVAGAKLVITNNTSTMHIADATRTPTVVLFAGTELECQWRPRHSPSRLLRRPTVCNPCYAFTCPYKLQCLDIPPAAVVAAGLDLFGQTSHPVAF